MLKEKMLSDTLHLVGLVCLPVMLAEGISASDGQLGQGFTEASPA